MSATPKKQRSKRRQRNRRGAWDYKIESKAIPELVTLPSGKRVPRHLVTPENPKKKGIQFLAAPKKKLASNA